MKLGEIETVAGEEHRRSGEEQKRLIEEFRKSQAALEEERSNWQRVPEEREQIIGEQRAALGQMEEAGAAMQEKTRVLEKAETELKDRIKRLSTERDELQRSYERQIGDLVVNRLRLRAPLQAVERLGATMHRRLCVARLAVESQLLGRSNRRHRVLATVCDIFPIYSQTFVYQELTQLARHGFDVRLVYSKLDSRDYLPAQFAHLWKVKRRLFFEPESSRGGLCPLPCPHARET